MKWVIYAGIALLAGWSIYWLVKKVRASLRGECACGGGASGCEDCAGCAMRQKCTARQEGKPRDNG